MIESLQVTLLGRCCVYEIQMLLYSVFRDSRLHCASKDDIRNEMDTGKFQSHFGLVFGLQLAPSVPLQMVTVWSNFGTTLMNFRGLLKL